jgi:predicted component of type VI protein secretion system
MGWPRDRIGFEVATESRFNLPIEDEEPFHIALIGDFAAGARRPLEGRRPVSVDPDNFEEVLSRFGVRVETSAASVRIAALDDFHPDSLYEKLPLFGEYRELRARLSNPATFGEAAREVLGETPDPAQGRDAGSLLDAILGGGEAVPRPARARDALDEFVRRAAQSSLAPGQDPRAPELIRQVDERAAAPMRAILRDPAFRRAEGAWRTVFQLLRRLEVGAQLKLFLVDVAEDEIRAHAEAVGRILLEAPHSWAAVACNFSLGSGDCALMRELGSVAREAKAPCIAEADPSLLGDTDRGSDWNVFRRSPEARWLGLAVGRILLRAPYGAQSDPCERFAFEEFADGPEARLMLYANPAPFCAMLLGQAFEASGWNLRPGEARDIDKLPVVTYRAPDSGEVRVVPCTEIELSASAAEALEAAGLMPVVHLRGTDIARVVRFQSVADPPAALAGRWGAR